MNWFRKNNKKEIDNLFNTAIDFANSGQYNESLLILTKLVGLYPSSNVYYNRGCIHSALNNYDEAISDFTEAILIDDKYIDAYINRGNRYADLNKPLEAAQNYSKAIELDPLNANPYCKRGFMYYLQRKYNEALIDINKSLELDPNLMEAITLKVLLLNK